MCDRDSINHKAGHNTKVKVVFKSDSLQTAAGYISCCLLMTWETLSCENISNKLILCQEDKSDFCQTKQMKVPTPSVQNITNEQFHIFLLNKLRVPVNCGKESRLIFNKKKKRNALKNCIFWKIVVWMLNNNWNLLKWMEMSFKAKRSKTLVNWRMLAKRRWRLAKVIMVSKKIRPRKASEENQKTYFFV